MTLPRPGAVGFFSIVPWPTSRGYREPASGKLAWMELRELADDQSLGMALFTGTLAERRKLHIEFRNYIEQARTYWRAGDRTEGAASALLYYYAALNLAKAELLQTNAAQIVGKFPHHGLKLKSTKGSSIRGDTIEVAKGVFPMLYRKRTGNTLIVGDQLRLTNLLSLIPEIGHEMSHFGTARPPAFPVYQTIFQSTTHAWSSLLADIDTVAMAREPIVRQLLREYEVVDFPAVQAHWRTWFALSSRTHGNMVTMFQSKDEFSTVANGVDAPDQERAQTLPLRVFGQAVAAPQHHRAEFVLTPSLTKSSQLVVPLDLVRYASMFYVSSIVRYRPSSLDSVREGKQAWLLDSFTTEVALNLLWNSVDGITGKVTTFEPTHYRL